MDFLTASLQSTDWWQRVIPINIVGTDGKGSTTAIVSSIFTALGLKCGRYTSPHLFRFNERIAINDIEICDADLEYYSNHISQLCEQYRTQYPHEEFGAFEIFTAIALHYFHAHRVQIVVLEAGIGGRYDSTRILSRQWGALTSVSLEHTQLLGNSITEIAYDKMDILPAGGNLVVGNLSPALSLPMATYARLKGVQLILASEACHTLSYNLIDNQMIVDVQLGALHWKRLISKLVGVHQLSNLQVAITLCWQIIQDELPTIPSERFIEAVQQAMANIRWRGRLEKISTQPTIYIDVGHTADALHHLKVSYLKIKNAETLLVFGVSEGRNVEQLFRMVSMVADEIIVTTASHRGAMAKEVFNIVRASTPKNIPIALIPDLQDAVPIAQKKAIENKQEILVAGSLFLAIEAQTITTGGQLAGLNFF